MDCQNNNKKKFSFIHINDDKPNYKECHLVEDLLTLEGLSLVYGASGVGKTFFVLDLCLHIAQGQDWHGKNVEQGSVLYIALEGVNGLKKRLDAHLKEHRLESKDVPFYRLEVNGLDLCRSNDNVNNVIEAIKEKNKELDVPIKLIVVDTLNGAINGGDENSSSDTGKLLGNIKKIMYDTKAHVMMVHHSGKKAEAGARGHSSIRSAVDTEIKITKSGDVHNVSVDKQRDMPEGATFGFRLKNVCLGENAYGKPVTSAVIETCDTSLTRANDNSGGNRSPLPLRQQEGYESLRELIDEEGGKTIAISIFRERFLEKYDGSRASGAKTFNRVKEALEKNNYCASDGDFISLCEPDSEKKTG